MNEIWCPPCNGNILGVFVAGSPCLVTILQNNGDSIYIPGLLVRFDHNHSLFGLGTIILCLAWAQCPGPVAESWTSTWQPCKDHKQTK